MSDAVKRIDHSRYLELLAGASVLERDRHGEKVLVLPDGALVKIFRRKRWLSTASVYPYARRFVANARRLAERGILSVQVLDFAYCPAVARHLVTYQPIPGTTLRQAMQSPAAVGWPLLDDFAQFVARLHHKGIYFRSLHFGNVIVSPDGSELGLIDVADLSFHANPLTVRQRVRNFSHMLRYREDQAALREYGWAKFFDAYLAAASLAPQEGHILKTRLRNIAASFPAAG